MTANVGDFLRSSLSASSCFLCRGSVLCFQGEKRKESWNFVSCHLFLWGMWEVVKRKRLDFVSAETQKNHLLTICSRLVFCCICKCIFVMKEKKRSLSFKEQRERNRKWERSQREVSSVLCVSVDRVVWCEWW